MLPLPSFPRSSLRPSFLPFADPSFCLAARDRGTACSALARRPRKRGKWGPGGAWRAVAPALFPAPPEPRRRGGGRAQRLPAPNKAGRFASARMKGSLSPPASDKPVVVLAGWLGCRPSQLRRYREFYEHRGYPTLVRVAAPRMVVASSIRPNALNPIRWPELGNHGRSSPASSSSAMAAAATTTTQDLAWEILGTLRSLGGPRCRFLVHSFSNGGCFVHEQLQRALALCRDSTPTQQQPPTTTAPGSLAPGSSPPTCREEGREDLQHLRLVGAVFDSCPGLDLSRIDDALSHCTEDEMADLEQSLPEFRQEILGRSLGEREAEYRRFLVEHDPLLPQLYVYSRSDPLAPFEPLQELVRERRRRAARHLARRPGGSASAAEAEAVVIRELALDDSPHCAHYPRHPDLYERALGSFLAEVAAAPDAEDDNGAAPAAPSRGEPVADPSTLRRSKL